MIQADKQFHFLYSLLYILKNNDPFWDNVLSRAVSFLFPTSSLYRIFLENQHKDLISRGFILKPLLVEYLSRNS